MVANNLELDDGIGTCGKEGQSVPVGVGQPSLKVRNLTVRWYYLISFFDSSNISSSYSINDSIAYSSKDF